MAIDNLPSTPHRYPIPRKLDDSMIEALYQAVRRVHTYPDASALCGISYQCFRRWELQAATDLKDGLSAETSIYVRLAEAVKRARAEVKAEMLDVIRNTAKEKKEWLPAGWYVERTDPDNFGRRDRHDYNINETKTINITRVEVLSAPGNPTQQLIEGEFKEVAEGDQEP